MLFPKFISMEYLYYAVLLVVLVKGIQGLGKVYVDIKHVARWQTMAQDLLTLADILDYSIPARQAMYYIEKIKSSSGNEMAIRLAYYYLAIDVLAVLNTDYLLLKREAKGLTESNWLAFENKLHNIVQSEMEYISSYNYNR